MAIQFTMYLNEADEWKGRPLHLQVLKCLQEEKVENAVVFHAVAGFVGGSRIKTASLVDAGGKLPLVLIFVVETEEQAARILPRMREMAAKRVIALENVVLV